MDNLHPLADSNPLLDSESDARTAARQHTPAAEAAAWLAYPQPPPPPIELHERIAREIAEAIGWPLENVQEAITELHETDPEKRRCLVSRQIK